MFMLFLVFTMGIIFFVIPPWEDVYAGESLYFDQEGNLVFATYDRAATSKIRYLTAGWTIKKYDEPLSYKGQVYGTISKPEFYYKVQDKNNPEYVYVYFIMKKKDVMSVINKASSVWGAGLEKYGGTIYIDSVMTVTEYGVQKGGLYSNGVGWGEIYYDYWGISKARWWADPTCLKAYFDISVAFPPQTAKPPAVYKDNVIKII